MILLDTHVLLWADDIPGHLGQAAIDRIKQGRGQLWCSAISFWEVAMLVEKKRISLSIPLDHWVKRVREQGGVKVADITTEIAYDAGTLPGNIHGDPGDRLLIATSRALGYPLLTVDHAVLAYAKAGYLQTIDARR